VAPPHYAVNAPPLPLRHELARKALHVAAAVFPVAYGLGVSRGVIALALCVTSALALLIEGLRRTNTLAGAMFDRAFGSITRQHEEQSITGATWLALSCLVAVLVLSRNAAIGSMWCAAAGDPAATIAGRLLVIRNGTGATRERTKTIVGSLACALVSFVGTWMLAGYSPASAAAIALTATVAEAIPTRLDDNLRIVGAAGAIAQYLA
jgi:dolichol kinase